MRPTGKKKGDHSSAVSNRHYWLVVYASIFVAAFAFMPGRKRDKTRPFPKPPISTGPWKNQSAKFLTGIGHSLSPRKGYGREVAVYERFSGREAFARNRWHAVKALGPPATVSVNHLPS
jgi:hypothetical protein